MKYQMGNKLGIRRSLKNGTSGFEFSPEFGYIDYVSIMSQCEDSVDLLHEKGLGIAKHRTSSCGITDMPNSQFSFHLLQHAFLEHIGGKTHAFVSRDVRAVANHDPCGFLATVLKSVES